MSSGCIIASRTRGGMANATARQLFLAGIIGRVDVVHGPRTNTVDLPDRFFTRPYIMVRLRLHHGHAARSPSGRVLEEFELVADSHVQGAGNDRDMFDPGCQ